MTQFVFENFVNTTLADAASSTATTLTLSSATGLPSTLAQGQQIPLVLNSASNGSVFEVCYITAINGSAVTVLRAQEGTSAQNWNVGDYAYVAMTAGTTAPVIATHSPTASETLPAVNRLVVTPGTLTAAIDLTLNDAAAAGSGATIYGSAADYAVTVQSPVTTGSPYIELPDGSQVYSWTIPAASPSQGIRVDWDGTNWRARTFGQQVVAPATQNNAAAQIGQITQDPLFHYNPIHFGAGNNYTGTQTTYKQTYGRYRHAVAAAFIANSSSLDNVQVMGGGGTNESLLAGYSSRDSVAVYMSNTSTTAISGSSTTFTSTTVTATWSASIADIPEGAFVDVQDGSTLYTGAIQSISGDTITVDGWTESPSSPATQGTPANGSTAIVNPQTKIWGQNTVVGVPSGSQATACAGYELDTEVNQSNVTSWGFDSVNLGSEQGTAAFIARGKWGTFFGGQSSVNGTVICGFVGDGCAWGQTLSLAGNIGGTIPSNPAQSAGQGLFAAWNYTSGGGEVDFFNYNGTAAGGYNFYNMGNSNSPTLANINIAAATNSSHAVALQQVQSVSPVVQSTTVSSPAASSTYTVNASFTAPCDGYVLVFGSLGLAGIPTSGSQISVTAQLNGTNGTSDNSALPTTTEFAQGAVTSGSSVTASLSVTTNSTAPGQAIDLHVAAIFVPNP